MLKTKSGSPKNYKRCFIFFSTKKKFQKNKIKQNFSISKNIILWNLLLFNYDLSLTMDGLCL